MVASGFAGLAYQIVWTQQSTSWLGHESAAVLAVVAAFFGGLALGALSLGARSERSVRPARWYAGCEVIIGLWSLSLAALLEPASMALLTLLGPQPSPLWHWLFAFCGTFLLLLPATMAMGATLPAMERVLTGGPSRNASISVLYAANTAGAVIGVITAAFWLVPEIGLARTAIVCAALNIACALVAMRLRTNVVAGVSFESSGDPLDGSKRQRGGKRMLWLLASTGLLGIGYEVLVVRALSQIAENTVYTFALLLAVYLIGTALGAALHARWLARKGAIFGTSSDPAPVDRARPAKSSPGLRGDLASAAEPTEATAGLQDDPASAARTRLRNLLLQALAAACLLGTLLLAGAGTVKRWLLAVLGPSVASALIGEAAIAALAFFLPTMLMGALFSHLSTTARDSGIGFGRAIGVNTLGAAISPVLFGVVLLPMIGLKPTLILVSAGYLLLVARSAWMQAAQWLSIASAVGCVLWAPSLLNTNISPDSKLLRHIEGVMASVSVIEDASGIATLHINNRQQEGSSATLMADARQALLPILLHPSPRHALFLGLGTGLTASSATLQPALQVDAVELIPEVIVASATFASSYADGADLTRLHMKSADARRYIRTSDQQYDVIVADNFHPARSGSASLYTTEHFQSVRERLAEDGLFCQWLPLHQLDLDTLRSIVGSYLSVFPRGAAVLATHSLDTPTIGLISNRGGEPFDVTTVRDHLALPRAVALEQFGIRDELSLMGAFIAGPNALVKFADGAPLNTDDRPVVAYRAPAITYSPSSLPRDRLLQLLHEVHVSPSEVVIGATPEWSGRLAAYWQARDRFIEVGREVRPTPDVRDMLAQVHEPLLSVLRISPEFRPAYDPLLRMARALSQENPEAARGLLMELQRIRAGRLEAAPLGEQP